jgi:hypothetical protein
VFFHFVLLKISVLAEKKVTLLNQSLTKNNVKLSDCNQKIRDNERLLEREVIIEANLREEIISVEQNYDKKHKHHEFNWFHLFLFFFILFFFLVPNYLHVFLNLKRNVLNFVNFILQLLHLKNVLI